MESLWNTVPWNPYGMVHGVLMEWYMNLQCQSIGNSMESTWTNPWNPYGMHHSMDIPYGFHSGYGMKKWLGCQPKKSPYGVHGMRVESIWKIPGSVKTSNFECPMSGPNERDSTLHQRQCSVMSV